MALSKSLWPHDEPQKWFLDQLFRHQQYLAQMYSTKPLEERGKPLVANITGVEVGLSPLYTKVDTSRFIFPTCLLHRVSVSDPSASQSTSILPLIRCVGVVHALRIMAALLSERRIIMVSSSPTRLAFCSHSALGMLAQGLLHWQHLYIPVMPPHLWQYLAAPYPYLIGILSSTVSKLDRTDGLGEVLMIHLDSNQMETRGMDTATIASRLPDLFHSQDLVPKGGAASVSELLAQDLVEVLKSDKKVLHGESTLAQMGETAAKASKAVKKTFFKLRDKGRDLLAKRSNSGVEGDEGELTVLADGPAETNTLAADYIYTEGCHNEVSEEDVRIAFTTFFLCTFGDMRWYLSAAPGQPPKLDRNRFLQQKRSVGEGEGTPMWPLLQNFCQTQMLEEFSKARMEEVRTRQPVTPDAPLFTQCANYNRQHNVDFGLLNVRRVTRQVAQANPARMTAMLQTNARRTAMALTSNKSFEGDTSRAIAQLVEQCRESTSILFDVMSVVWLRIRDSKGMQWKHAFQALQILRNLLYHGPLAAIAEATDGLEKIRALKFYDHMRVQVTQEVRTAAGHVFELLVDRARLFNIRRACAERRRTLQSAGPKFVRDTRLRINSPFKAVHAALHPNAARGTIARIPSTPSPHSQLTQHGNHDVNEARPLSNPNEDLLGIFTDMDVSAQTPSTGLGTSPFDVSNSSTQAKVEVATPVANGSLAPISQGSPYAHQQGSAIQGQISMLPQQQKQPQQHQMAPTPTFATLPPGGAQLNHQYHAAAQSQIPVQQGPPSTPPQHLQNQVAPLPQQHYSVQRMSPQTLSTNPQPPPGVSGYGVYGPDQPPQMQSNSGQCQVPGFAFTPQGYPPQDVGVHLQQPAQGRLAHQPPKKDLSGFDPFA